ncbi:MAG: DUF4411 family protein [Promethearchaeota archaeon]
MMVYIFDSSAFIDLKNRFPRKSTIPFFRKLWVTIENSIQKREIIIIEEVKREIFEGNDELTEFFKELPKTIFLDYDEAIQGNLSKVVNSPSGKPLVGIGKKNEADLFLVATAITIDGIIVSNECKKRGHGLPLLCRSFNVKIIDLNEYLERVFGEE